MPVAKVKTPDGKIMTIKVPDGATNEQIAAFAKSQYKPEPLGLWGSAKLGTQKAGIGAIQLGMDAARQLGYDFPETYAASERVAKQLDEQGRGSGVVGVIGEALGNPLTLPTAALSGGASLLRMAGAGAAQGAASGALDPTQKGESRLENTAIGGAIGGIAAPATKVVGDTISDAVSPYFGKFIRSNSSVPMGRVKPEIMPFEDIQAMASKSYDDAAKAGGVIRPDAVNKIIAKAQGIGAKSQGAQRFQGGQKDAVDTVVAKMQNLQNRGMTLRDVQEIDDILQDSISKEFVAGSGLTNEGRKISQIRDMFHNAHSELQPRDFIGGNAGFRAWREGDRLFAASSNAKQVEGIINNAMSADNPAMALKTGFRTLLRNKRNLRGFSQDEIKFIKHASNTGEITDLLRTVGSRLNPIIATSTGGADAGLAAYGVSKISREMANTAQGRRADKVLQAITSRATGSPMPSLRVGTTPLGAAGGAAATGAGVSGVTQYPEPYQQAPQPQPAPTLEPLDFPQQQKPQSSLTPTQQNEGFRGTVYNDMMGNPTIGYGFNLNSGIAPKVWEQAGFDPKALPLVKAGKLSISEQHGEALYRAAEKIATDDARKYVSNFNELSEPRKAALIDLSYQLGYPRLAKFETVKKHIENGKFALAARELTASKWFKQTGKERRNWVLQQLVRG